MNDDNDNDDNDFDAKFESLNQEFTLKKVAFKKEMDEIDQQIQKLETQKKEISEKYGLPYTITNYHTYIPTKFIESYKDYINNSEYLEDLIGNFDMNYSLCDVLSECGNLQQGINGWEPSNCW